MGVNSRAALTGKHDTLVRRAPGWQGARLSTEGLGPRHGEVRRAHQMLNAALVNSLPKTVTRQRRDCDLNPGTQKIGSFFCLAV